MIPSIDQIIVWVIVGLLGGTCAGALVTWSRSGFGLMRNLGMGLIGALVGGLLFRLLGLWSSLDRITISLRDVVAAAIGSLLVFAVFWLWERQRPGSRKRP